MSTGSLPAQQIARHNSESLPVTPAMARFRAAVPLLRALLLVGVVIVLIMFALPRVLAIAAAASL